MARNVGTGPQWVFEWPIGDKHFEHEKAVRVNFASEQIRCKARLPK
jgi:hypothetical protein